MVKIAKVGMRGESYAKFEELKLRGIDVSNVRKTILPDQFDKILVCGTDNEVFINLLKENGIKAKIIAPKVQPLSVESMFQLAEKMIADGEKPLADYDGPVYLRASEAEVKLQEKN